MPLELTDANFEQEVIKSEKPSVVDFWAEWCGPCKILAPRFIEIEKELPDVKFGKLNVDENENTSMKYGIRSIPTLLIFKGGKPVGQVIGAMSKDAMKIRIEAALR